MGRPVCPLLLSRINKGRCAPLCLSVCHFVTDEYKMKGVEKVKYISGEEGGVDGQDSTVSEPIVFFVFYFMSIMCLNVDPVYWFVKIINL